jgi:hypothetical protein
MPDDEYVIRPPRPPTPTNWNLIVSIAAAVAAFMCAVFTAWYAYEARQTRINAEKSGNQQEEYVRQALQASQRSAAAAEGSHEEAHKSAEIAREQINNSLKFFQDDERARVNVTAMERTTALTTDAPMNYRVLLQNTGKTPAVRAYAHVWVTVRPTFEPLYPDNNDPATRDIAAGGLQVLQVSAPLTKPMLDSLKDRQSRIWVWGICTYFDIFDHTHKHQTRFCGMAPYDFADIIQSTLTPCPTHNSAN